MVVAIGVFLAKRANSTADSIGDAPCWLAQRKAECFLLQCL
jgi:hypothetical protein